MQASQVLEKAITLRQQVQGDISTKSFGSDDLRMGVYNELIHDGAYLFPNDPILNGGMVKMPDAVLQTFGTLLPVQNMVADLPSKRLESRLTKFIDRLTSVANVSVQQSQQEPLSTDVSEQRANDEIAQVLEALEGLLSRQSDDPKLEARDFAFITNPQLQSLLSQDFEEAQRAFAAGAPKASAILCGGIIEGILLDKLQHSPTTSHTNYKTSISHFPKDTAGNVDWNRVSLTQLIRAIGALGLLSQSALSLTDSARDFRDTVHPNAEIREGIRAEKEEAKLLIAFVELIYRDLGK